MSHMGKKLPVLSIYFKGRYLWRNRSWWIFINLIWLKSLFAIKRDYKAKTELLADLLLQSFFIIINLPSFVSLFSPTLFISTLLNINDLYFTFELSIYSSIFNNYHLYHNHYRHLISTTSNGHYRHLISTTSDGHWMRVWQINAFGCIIHH